MKLNSFKFTSPHGDGNPLELYNRKTFRLLKVLNSLPLTGMETFEGRGNFCTLPEMF